MCPINIKDQRNFSICYIRWLVPNNVMPLGLKNSQAIFQRVMTSCLESVEFVDDIVVFSKQNVPYIEGD